MKEPVAFTVWEGLTPYPQAMERMEALRQQVLAGGPETVVFCEHPPTLTLGSSASVADIHPSFARTYPETPILESGRGGKITWHGPGQLVAYPIVRLTRFHTDIRAYMQWLQTITQATLATYNIQAETRQGAELGLWVGGAKIAAFGVKVRQGITTHGLALNVSNSLEPYQHFTPCGLTLPVTRVIAHIPNLTTPAILHTLQRIILNTSTITYRAPSTATV